MPENTPTMGAEAQAALAAILAERDIVTADAWIPQEGDALIGEIISMDIRRNETNGYAEYPCVTYKLGDGSFVAVHAFHQILQERLKEMKAEPGSRHYLRCEGVKFKRNPTQDEIDKGRNFYHSYFVRDWPAAEMPMLGKVVTGDPSGAAAITETADAMRTKAKKEDQKAPF